MGPSGKEGLILWPVLLCSSQEELGQVRGIELHITTTLRICIVALYTVVHEGTKSQNQSL